MNFEVASEEAPLTPEEEAQLRKIVLDSAPDALSALENAQSEAEAFVYLPRAAAAAFQLERFDDAKKFAEQALALVPSFSKDWNAGNAIHLGHTVLGLLALRWDDLEVAIDELIKSGDTPGLPQINSFGPTMHLAKELLKRRQTEPVLVCLKACHEFWKMGGTWLDLWEGKIAAGQMPNCFQHS